VFDADLDGHLDLLTANGHINPRIDLVDGAVTFRQPPQLYRNLGDGTFSVAELGDEVSGVRMVGRGAAYGDFDRDGDLDVLLVENGGPAHLWRNDLREGADLNDRNGFLRVRLDGRLSNRPGIGARIEAVAGSRRIVRFVRTGSSYLSSSETTVTFGLGTTALVDSLIVYWPSGEVGTYTHILANQEIMVAEGGGFVATKMDHRAEEVLE
ncbi:MAG TPA: CRTAC1 family protein, partial [Rhodothermales bacterium]|nr:CRTAC1 family protein [Rhodothermales bacterium]